MGCGDIPKGEKNGRLETKKQEKETVTDDSDVNDKRTIMFRT